MAREPLAAKRARTEEILRRLEQAYPDTTISLRYESHFQLAVAVILSAQCTDAMVNKVTTKLFKKYRNVNDFANADPKEFEKDIRPTGYFRAKTRNILALARTLRDTYGGNLPASMKELVELPGIGRKTANVILWNAFGKSEGIAVDTHVTRVTRLLMLTRHANPEKIERDLIRLVPKPAWGQFTHLMIDHGRAVCVANRPRCERCVLNDLCPSARRPLDPLLISQHSS